MEGSVTTTISDSIGTIEFYSSKGNSLPGSLLTDLTESITKAGANDSISVVILKSSGEGAFCAGASFSELMAIDSEESGATFFMGFANVILAMRNCPKLIIVRVQGKAVGGGVGLAAAGDFCFAHEDASVKLSELSLGIGPFVIAPVVERKIGVSALSTLTIQVSKWQTANWASSKGLYNEVLSSHLELDQEINTLANELSGYSIEAMKSIKAMLWEQTEHFDSLLKERASTSGRLAQSSFTKDFINRFNSKSN